jgi:FkbM family methyltransferase
MILLTGFYSDPDPRRRGELVECVKLNAANDHIDEVRVFIEDATQPETLAATHFGDQSKVTLIPLGHRLTFKFLFEYANENLQDRTVIIANADIFFNETLERLNGYDLIGKLICLSRWDMQPDGSLQFFPHAGSQDVWIFKTPLPQINCDFQLGLPASDNRLAWEAERAGLEVSNPARTICAGHMHLSQVRRYSERQRLPGPVKGVPPDFLHTPRSAPPLPPASVAFTETMGYTIAKLEAGASSHNNDLRPLTAIPEPLMGLQFTQVVAWSVSPVSVEFLTPGKFYALVGTDWSGYWPATTWLSEHGYKENLPPLETERGTSFEIWSRVGQAGERLVIPTQVGLAAQALTRHEPSPPRRAENHASQLGQEDVVDEYLGGKRNGVFVDIGAYDGVTYSNTLMLEQERGWTGVCIEPLPDVCAELRKNRSCICVQACVGNRDEPAVEFLAVQSAVVRTRMLSGVLSEYDPAHLARIENELSVFGGSKSVIQVPMRPLHAILHEHGIDKVDYLSIDTEGSELLILSSTTLSAIGNPCITVENNYNDPAIDAALRDQGYRLHTTIAWDRFYVYGD